MNANDRLLEGRPPTPVGAHLGLATERLRRGLDWFTEAERSPSTKRLFRNLFFAWLLLHTLLLLPFAREIFAPDSLVIREPFDASSLVHWVFRLSLAPGFEGFYTVFVVVQVGLLCAALTGVTSRLVTLLIYVATLNVNAMAPSLLDGGNNLSELLLLYLVLVDTSGHHRIARTDWDRLRIAVSNAGLVLMRLQVVIVYLTAGMLKLSGVLWQRGMALYYILQADAFSHPWMNEIVTRWPWVGMIGTYTTLAFQWLFPTMVWFRRTRPWILTLGVMLHLGIAFGMGLLTFGLIMCLVYVLFLEERTTARVLGGLGAVPRLEVTVRGDARRLPGLVAALARLAPADSVRLTVTADPQAPRLLVGESPALRRPSEDEPVAQGDAVPASVSGEHRWCGAAALLRLTARCRWTWPFFPLHLSLALVWYLGLGGRLFDLAFPIVAAVEDAREHGRAAVG